MAAHHRWRFPRIGLAIFALVASLIVPQPASPSARAVDVCSSSHCATLALSFTGTGSAHVVDDWGQLDCSYNGSARSGTCDALYVWALFVGSIDVTLTATPSSNSCIRDTPFTCTPVGQAYASHVTLNPGDSKTATFDVEIAAHAVVVISASGDGGGRVTSKPAGIDCRVSAATKSGTCTYGWYYSTPGLDITLTGTPNAFDYACFTSCGEVGAPLDYPYTFLLGQPSTKSVAFLKGHPIVTVAVSGRGTVTTDPSLITCPGSCSSYVPESFALTLTAKPKAGWAFDHWTGICSSTGAKCTISPASKADIGLTAVFRSLATPRPSGTPRATVGPTRSPQATAGAPTGSPDAGQTAPPPSGGSIGRGDVGNAGATPADGGSGSAPAPSTSQERDAAPFIVVLVSLLGVVLLLLALLLLYLRRVRRPRDL